LPVPEGSPGSQGIVDLIFPLFEGKAATDLEKYHARVIAYFLGGQGRMNSPLFLVMREKLRCTYSISCGLFEFDTDCFFACQFGTKPDETSLMGCMTPLLDIFHKVSTTGLRLGVLRALMAPMDGGVAQKASGDAAISSITKNILNGESCVIAKQFCSKDLQQEIIDAVCAAIHPTRARLLAFNWDGRG
jgi:hypothetical protein